MSQIFKLTLIPVAFKNYDGWLPCLQTHFFSSKLPGFFTLLCFLTIFMSRLYEQGEMNVMEAASMEIHNYQCENFFSFLCNKIKLTMETEMYLVKS